MKEVFKFTFSAISEYKKLTLLGIIVFVLSLIEMYPIIFIISYSIEKIILFSVGAILVYLIIRSKDENAFFEHIKIQPIPTFLFHFLPTGMGIMLGNIILISVFVAILYLALYFTNSLSLLFMINPHEINTNKIPFILMIDLLIVTIYFSLVSYIYLGKLGSALSKESFKESFLEIISTAIDFKYLKKAFNKKYFIIFLIWSIVAFLFYLFSTFVFNLYIYPQLRFAPNINAIVFTFILSFASVIINYFTFISAYFANKSISKDEERKLK